MQEESYKKSDLIQVSISVLVVIGIEHERQYRSRDAKKRLGLQAQPAPWL